MKYHITKHAQQRRRHYEIIPEEELQGFMQSLDEVLNFENLTPGKYKLNYKSFGAIVSKENQKLVLITIRNHTKLLPENRSKIKMHRAETAFRSGEGLRITRLNFKGRVVKCGYVIERPDGLKLMVISAGVQRKYKMPPYNKAGTLFMDLDDVKNWITFDGTEFQLNAFERIHDPLEMDGSIQASEIPDKKTWQYYKQRQIEKRTKNE